MEVIGDIKRLSRRKIYFIVLILTLLLFILVSGFFNQILFILYGYDLGLLNKTSFESFEAYRSVGKIKLPILIALMLLSVISFIWTLKSIDKLNKWMYVILFIVFGKIAFIATAFLLFYFVAPSNVLQ